VCVAEGHKRGHCAEKASDNDQLLFQMETLVSLAAKRIEVRVLSTQSRHVEQRINQK